MKFSKNFLFVCLMSTILIALSAQALDENPKQVANIINLIKLRKSMLQHRISQDKTFVNYQNNEEVAINKRIKNLDYALSTEERRKIDQASEIAFRKLKKFYVIASRSRFGR